MSRYENKCDICNKLEEDYEGRYVYIKFKCPSYFGTAGRIINIRDNLIFIEYIYGGITVTCCDNVSFVIPISPGLFKS